ncbi:hypothetical protein P3X46_026899 [Hevea brasiliensis]|uniref:Leucine-rich repeat-containing N-terminal plant-type domain-containing protein n=2 Tax=Hevea brasiliensis TaxID=3981 RepID=A0ABQ9KZL8_HEVBR|nr:hypothetical protein P3X46_026899 [Hevea brasiliensis]
MEVIDFSNNLLDGPIPSSLFHLPSLRYLFLQNNSLTGHISHFQFHKLRYLDLSNNLLDGPIPSSVSRLVNLRVLILSSNNKLIQEIPPSICELKSLQILDLSKNGLSGSIPYCLGSFKKLLVLGLGLNNFQGTIFTTFSEGNSLRYLNFNGNKFQGHIPKSITNCRYLEVLDLGSNKIEDTFPSFLGTLTELRVLILRFNKLHGSMQSPSTNFSFPKLRILDVSNNVLSGNLPSNFFKDLKAMMDVDSYMEYMMMKDYSYDYSARMILKGLEIELVKIQTTLTVIDLSGNKFTGEIPEAMWKLKALKQLNLSHNRLTGCILSSLGNLSNLESLDLSYNLLTGEIPIHLVDLTFLQILNLSYNQLEGPIPQGKQFNTFENSSYEGNLGLCGFPLSKSCNSGDIIKQLVPLPNLQEGDATGFGWKSVSIGFGCGLPFGFSMGYMTQTRRRRAWFVRLIQSVASTFKKV